MNALTALRLSHMRPAAAAGLTLSALVFAAAAAAPRAGPVVGVIDAVRYEADQYYVFGWACQQGNRSSIAIQAALPNWIASSLRSSQ